MTQNQSKLEQLHESNLSCDFRFAPLAKDMFTSRIGSGTCNLKNVAPQIHDRLENVRRTFDLKKGDVIFATRWLFHRTIPIDRAVSKALRDQKKLPIFRRYSVRYSLGSAKLHSGYSTEPSVLYECMHEGMRLDDVSSSVVPWYPEVGEVNAKGMAPDSEFITRIRPAAQDALRKRQKEMRPYLEALSDHNVELKKQEVISMFQGEKEGSSSNEL